MSRESLLFSNSGCSTRVFSLGKGRGASPLTHPAFYLLVTPALSLSLSRSRSLARSPSLSGSGRGESVVDLRGLRLARQPRQPGPGVKRRKIKWALFYVFTLERRKKPLPSEMRTRWAERSPRASARCFEALASSKSRLRSRRPPAATSRGRSSISPLPAPGANKLRPLGRSCQVLERQRRAQHFKEASPSRQKRLWRDSSAALETTLHDSLPARSPSSFSFADVPRPYRSEDAFLSGRQLSPCLPSLNAAVSPNSSNLGLKGFSR